MGANISDLVFKPGESSTYTENSVDGIQWTSALESSGSNTSLTDSPGENAPDSGSQIVQGRPVPFIYYKWKGRNGETAHFTLLYSGDNVSDLGVNSKWAQMLRDCLHVDVVCYEYTGYGINRVAKPSEKHCYEDIATVFSFVTGVLGVPSSKIILMGKSIGSGPTLHLASQLYSNKVGKSFVMRSFGRRFQKKNISLYAQLLNLQSLTSTRELGFGGLAGIILESPLSSILDLHTEVTNALAADMFENVKKIKKVKCPVFIVHGTKDTIIPISHSHKLVKAMQEGVLWKFLELKEAGHSDIDTEYSDELLDTLVDFVQYLTPKDVLSQQQKQAALVPSTFSMSPNQVVFRWLKNIHMEKYTDLFLANGYYDELSISKVNDLELDLIGVSDPKDREIILKAAGESAPGEVAQVENLASVGGEDEQKQPSAIHSTASVMTDAKLAEAVLQSSEKEEKQDLHPKLQLLAQAVVTQSKYIKKLGAQLTASQTVVKQQGEEIKTLQEELKRTREQVYQLIELVKKVSDVSAPSSLEEATNPIEPIISIPKEHRALVGWSGTISRENATKKLESQPVGMFLLRWSPTQQSFVLSVRSDTGVTHIYDIRQKRNGQVSVGKADGGTRVFPNMLEYVNAMKQEKIITQPIEAISEGEESPYVRSPFAASTPDTKRVHSTTM